MEEKTEFNAYPEFIKIVNDIIAVQQYLDVTAFKPQIKYSFRAGKALFAIILTYC